VVVSGVCHTVRRFLALQSSPERKEKFDMNPRTPKPLAHNSFNEPFNHGYSKEYRKGYDMIDWSGTNQKVPRELRCALCKSPLIQLSTGEIVCTNHECFNFGEEEEEDESTDSSMPELA
jgi:hypothetical protein